MPTEALSHILYATKALSSRTRLRIVGVLEGRELFVGQVAAIFDIARSTASEHLSELRRASLLAERRDGQFAWFGLAGDEEVRGILDGVRRGISADATVHRDREVAERILALPHELVCEKGRAALDSSTSPAASVADPDAPYCFTSKSNTDPQEVP